MAYENFLRLGCLELIGPQAVKYAGVCGFPYNVLPCCACSGLDVATGYPDGWTDPVTDEAPWYDATEPESPNFAGLLIQSVTGLGPGKFTRKVSENTLGGSVLGRGHRPGATVTVTGTLLGRTCCSVAYGLRWLKAALHGECTHVGCPGQDLTYLECCPAIPTGASSTFGPGGLGTATSTFIAPYIGVGLALNPNIGLEQGGGGTSQPFFNGGSYVIPPDTGPGPGSAVEHFRGTGGILKAPRPSCDAGTATITVSARMTNDGPTNVSGSAGGLRIANGTTHVALVSDFLPANMAANTSDTVTCNVVVPAADLAAGNITALFFMETWQAAVGGKGWTLDRFEASYVYDTTGCPELQPLTDPAAIEATFESEWRTMKGVALVSDVEVVDRKGPSCGCGACPLTRVQFQLAATQPCVFRSPRQVVTEHRIRDGSPLIVNCFEWVPVADGEPCPDPELCAPAEECAFNPICPAPPKPPAPPVVIDSCLSCTPFDQYQSCAQISGDTFPAFATGVVSYQVYAGSTPLRHVRIRLYANPLGVPVEQLDPCAACSEINISYIPAGATFTVDSMEKSATVTCPGTSDADGSSLLGGPPGQLFDWPELACGGVDYTVCISAQGSDPDVSPVAALHVSVAAKEC